MKKLVSVLLALAMLFGAFTFVYADEYYFTDVTSGWALPYVNRAFSEGVINGNSYDETTGLRTFNPNGTLTYAQFIAIMARKFFPEDIAATEFPESVAAAIGSGNLSKWWASSYYAAMKNGLLLKDISAADFVSQPIKRKDMAYVIYMIFNAKGREIKVSDAAIESVPDYVYAAEGENLANAQIYMIVIAACYKLGIINGADAEGNFKPNNNVTRAQAAAIFCRTEDVFNRAELETEMIALVNKEREAAGLAPLAADSVLTAAAETRAAEVVPQLIHTRPNGDSFTTAIDNSDGRFATAGENLAATNDGSDIVVALWMEPGANRTNMLNENYDSVGAGVYVSEETDYKYYWVLIFARKTAKPETQPDDATDDASDQETSDAQS